MILHGKKLDKLLISHIALTVFIISALLMCLTTYPEAKYGGIAVMFEETDEGLYLRDTNGDLYEADSYSKDRFFFVDIDERIFEKDEHCWKISIIAKRFYKIISVFFLISFLLLFYIHVLIPGIKTIVEQKNHLIPK